MSDATNVRKSHDVKTNWFPSGVWDTPHELEIHPEKVQLALWSKDQARHEMPVLTIQIKVTSMHEVVILFTEDKEDDGVSLFLQLPPNGFIRRRAYSKVEVSAFMIDKRDKMAFAKSSGSSSSSSADGGAFAADMVPCPQTPEA